MNSTSTFTFTYRHKDLTGKRFGSLVATRVAGTTGKRLVWEALCDCGKQVVKNSSDLIRAEFCGHTCPLLDTLRSTQKKLHGKSNHPSYAVYRSMIRRCYNTKTRAYPNYGGRGISVCAKWRKGYTYFWEDMGPSWEPGLWIDRKDVNKNYDPSNCRWVTPKESARNKRNSKIPAWALDEAAKNKIPRSTLHYRIKNRVPLTVACTALPNATRTFSKISLAHNAQ